MSAMYARYSILYTIYIQVYIVYLDSHLAVIAGHGSVLGVCTGVSAHPLRLDEEKIVIILEIS